MTTPRQENEEYQTLDCGDLIKDQTGAVQMALQTIIQDGYQGDVPTDNRPYGKKGL